MSTQTTSNPGALPCILPDETLYSWASRYHRLTGCLRATDTSQLLFGDHHAGLRHDFPSGLRHLVRVTNGAFGSAQYLIENHTLLPYFLPLLRACDARAACKCLLEPHIDSLKYRLGLLTSRFRAHHPLKLCPACIDEDTERLGFPYWHIAHQWPGSWICTKHDELFLVSVYKVNEIQRFQWGLPDTARRQTPPVDIGTLASDVRNTLMRLSRLAGTWSADSEFRDVGQILRRAYMLVFRDRGWVTSAGRLRLRYAGEHFATHLSGLHCFPEFSHLPRDPVQAHTQLGRLLRQPRTGTHPLRHLVMIEWLFPDWQDFKRCLHTAKHLALPIETQPSALTAPTQIFETCEPIAKALARTTHTRPDTARVSRGQTSRARLCAKQGKNRMGSRPKKLKAELMAAILRDLERGVEKHVVTDRHQISIPTINRLLRANPNLNHAWRIQNHLRRRRTRRYRWKRLLQRHSSLGLKRLRTRAPAVYTWLYRHDRDWLDRVNRCISPQPKSNHAHTDWPALDQALATKVTTAALSLGSSYRNRQIKLWELCAEIPDLRARLASAHNLPKTIKAISQARRINNA